MKLKRVFQRSDSKARGQAARRLEEAKAYRAQVIAEAQGEASRFEQLLTAYQKAPDVTRTRLYLETLEAVLARTSKVLVDVNGTNNLLYLPLDRLLKPDELLNSSSAPRTSASGAVSEAAPTAAAPADDNTAVGRLRDLNRSREVR
ncbi:MAG: hypothetical protein U1F42_08160 [Candidatus Competibacteraceae bacterium]